MMFLDARRRARQLFPTYSRTRRARWVWLALRSSGPRIPISSSVDHAIDQYRFLRASRHVRR